MIIMELLCSPRPASFNHALAERARRTLVAAGHRLLFHDLDEEGFDPVMDSAELARGFSLDPLVQRHCRELESAGGLIVFHPDWWGGPPARLKGWIDRVLRQGIAYDLEGGEFSDKTWRPLLEGRRALVYVSSDRAEPGSSPHLEALWKELILGSCGMEAECHVLSNLRGIKPQERVAWLNSLEARLLEAFPAGSEARRGA
jgi:NAD(P)H dehydrogenase (quinone)